jgi:hypothetical protein
MEISWEKELMKKILFFSLILFNLVAHAEWIEVGHSDQRAFEMFYDPSTIQNTGDISTVKVLKNYKTPQNSVDPNKPYIFLSNTSTQEIKCAENKERLLYIEMWSDLNATGKMEQSHDYAGKKDWGRRFKITSI